MIAQPFVTGPVHVLVNFKSGHFGTPAGGGGGGGPQYLGTTERGPTIVINRRWKPISSGAFFGADQPFDKTYGGREAIITTPVNVINMATYRKLQPFAPGGGGGGTDAVSSMGTMHLLEGAAIILILVFPYQEVPAYSSMAKGYRFPGASIIAPERLEPLGTEPKKITITWHAMQVLGGKGKEAVLFDENTGLTAGQSIQKAAGL